MGQVVINPASTSVANVFTATQSFRAPAGVTGTDEIQISHDGSRGLVESKDGYLELRSGDMIAGRSVIVTQYGGGAPCISAIGANRLGLDGVVSIGGGSGAGWFVNGSTGNWVSTNPNYGIEAAYALFYSPNAAWCPTTIRGFTGQTAPLTQWMDPTGATTLAKVDAAGNVHATVFVGGAIYDATTKLSISLSDTTGVSISNGVVGYADMNLSGRLISPWNTRPELTANANDLDLGKYRNVRISSDAARSITGILAGFDGEERLVVNVGAFNITLENQDAGSTAENRLLCPGGADVVLAPDEAVKIVYDDTTDRWRVWKL